MGEVVQERVTTGQHLQDQHTQPEGGHARSALRPLRRAWQDGQLRRERDTQGGAVSERGARAREGQAS